MHGGWVETSSSRSGKSSATVSLSTSEQFPMPRRSAASIAIPVPAKPISTARLEPPRHLKRHQKAIWLEVVGSLSADWFTPEHSAILERYVHHVARSRELEQLLTKCNPDLHLDRYLSLSRAATVESKTVLALARSMRLTHQARLRATAAAALASKRGGSLLHGADALRTIMTLENE